MANVKTPYGAVLDTASSALTTGFPIHTVVITETGGTAGGVITISDEDGNAIVKAAVGASDTLYIPLGAISPDGVRFSTTGGTMVVSLIRRAK